MVCAVKAVLLAVVAGVKGVDVSGFLIPYQLLAAAAVVVLKVVIFWCHNP